HPWGAVGADSSEPGPGRPGAVRRARWRGQRHDDGVGEVVSQLWVIVPAYQEEDRIGTTLDALAAQTDRDFTLLVVDNGSTDDTVAVVRRFAARAPLRVRITAEPERGTGCAVDTGFRYAISRGAALLARTDADCLPHPGWVAAAREALL